MDVWHQLDVKVSIPMSNFDYFTRENRFYVSIICLQWQSEPFNSSLGSLKVRCLNYLVTFSSWLHCLDIKGSCFVWVHKHKESFCPIWGICFILTGMKRKVMWNVDLGGYSVCIKQKQLQKWPFQLVKWNNWLLCLVVYCVNNISLSFELQLTSPWSLRWFFYGHLQNKLFMNSSKNIQLKL